MQHIDDYVADLWRFAFRSEQMAQNGVMLKMQQYIAGRSIGHLCRMHSTGIRSFLDAELS